MTYIKDFLILLLFVGTLIFAKIGSYPLQAPDGARYAEIPREMVVSGDYIIPHLNGIQYLEKPPLFYWMQAGSIKLLGANDFAVSLPNSLMSLFCCLFVYLIARRFYGRLSGILASIILITSFIFFSLTKIVTLDMTFTTWLTAALGCFLYGINEPNKKYKNYYMWGMYFFTALATLTKGLIGLFPCLIIFVWILFFNEWRNLKNYCIFSGVILFSAITLPWHILVQLQNPDFFNFYFLQQHFLRYLTSYAARSKPWWFLPSIFTLGIYPWLPFLIQSLKFNFPRNWDDRFQFKIPIFLMIWIIVVYIFYSLSNSQLATYLLPLYPPLSILIGHYLAKNWHSKEKKDIKWGFLIISFANTIIGVGCIIAEYFFGLKLPTLSSDFFYLTGWLMIFSGAAIAVFYGYKGTSGGTIALASTIALVLFATIPYITISNNQAIQPLALQLKSKLQADDIVVSYNAYYQDLPFYLNKNIIIVNYKGELAFGLQYGYINTWQDQQNFIKILKSNKKVYVVMEERDFKRLSLQPENHIYLISKHIKTVLASNQPA